VIPLPPLNFSGGNASGGTAGGGTSGGGNAFGSGDWNINLSGSAPTLQAATGGLSPWLLLAGVGVLWFMFRK
jgi:hypothetical protein